MAKLLIALTLICACTHASELDKVFEKAHFQIGEKKFEAYIADDDAKRSRGLMNVEKLPPDTGMLFIFDNEQILNFWMKNTLIPLHIAFLNAKAEVVDTQEMKPAASIISSDVPTYASRRPALFALEMNAGWFSKNKIPNGARLKLLSPAKSNLLKAKLGK